MKISKNIIKNTNNNLTCNVGKVKYSADRRIAASAADGTGQFVIVAPGGMDYIPQKNDDSLIIPTDSGKMCIGVRMSDNLYGIEPGEVALYSSGGASIILKNDGRVLINGTEYSGGE